MSFQIIALPAAPFAPLFGQSTKALAAQNIQRVLVDAPDSAPCRISLEDAPVGSTVLLLNYEHLPHASPYRARHAIYVREGAVEARLPADTIPDSIAKRLIAARSYDATGQMLDAEIVEGHDLPGLIVRLFDDDKAAFIQLHNARRGCYAARVERA